MFHTSPKLTSGPPRITSPGRAFYVQVAVPMPLPDGGRLLGSNLPHAGFRVADQSHRSMSVMAILGQLARPKGTSPSDLPTPRNS